MHSEGFQKKVLCPLNAPESNKMVSKIVTIPVKDTETSALTKIADKIHLIDEMKQLELRTEQSKFVRANIQKLFAQDKINGNTLVVLPLVDNSIELFYLVGSTLHLVKQLTKK